jgi:hypothetical protein
MDCLDKTRRTMSEALRTPELSQEALDFITGAAAKPSSHPVPVVNSEPPAAQSNAVSLALPPIAPSKSNRVLNEPSQLSPTPTSATISMTFRLPAHLAPRLFRASVERKLQRAHPFSQQDIVAEALANWLQSNCQP